MTTTSTVEVTTYGDLAYGDLFAVESGGVLRVAMKVAFRSTPADKPNNAVLLLSSDRAPELQSAQTLKERRVVAKMPGLTFAIRPEPADFLFNLEAPRARQTGCVFLVGSEIFLAAQTPLNEIAYINLKTGESLPRLQTGDTVAIARWRVIHRQGEIETPWLEYVVPVP